MCSQCGSQFSTKKEYGSHITNCQDKRLFKCDTCEKEFIGKKKLFNHMRSHKTSNCKLCGETFQKNSEYFHQKQCEGTPEVTVFKCDQCPYITNQKVHLKRHYLTHLEKKRIKYSCVHCKKSFHLKKHLDQHVKTHSKPKAKLPEHFNCILCGKQFRFKTNLNRHIKTDHVQTKFQIQLDLVLLKTVMIRKCQKMILIVINATTNVIDLII